MKRWTRWIIVGVVFATIGGFLAAAETNRGDAEVAPAGPKAAKPALPPGYKLLYEQKFDKPTAIGDFEFSDPKQWKIFRGGDVAALEFGGKGKYRPKVRSPLIIGLISGRVFGDFILEADLLQTGKQYGHRDMCLFFGFTDKSRYYYCHMATKADDHAHNIFIVNKKPRTKIAVKTTKGIDWGKDKWHKIRLERKASDGTIEVFFDNMTVPIMVAKDTTFKSGYVGFGSFDDSGRIDNIRIWGPKAKKKASSFFPGKTPGGAASVTAVETRPEPTNPIKGYTDTPLVPGTKWHIHDPNRPQPKYVQPKYDGKPVPPPAGATVLFDGKDLDKWRNKNWKLADGAMQVTKGGQQTLDSFGDMHLHVEWLVPDGIKGYCQKQGNSGVYLMCKYEVQVLNCYNNRTYADGMTAAMYGQYPPMVNACRKPGQWQAFDIHFKAPVFKDGKLVQGAYVTVYHNNVLVHDNAMYMGASTWRRTATYREHPPKAPISLQAHGSPVRYRNIWVKPLTKKLGPGAPKSGK